MSGINVTGNPSILVGTMPAATAVASALLVDIADFEQHGPPPSGG